MLGFIRQGARLRIQKPRFAQEDRDFRQEKATLFTF